MANYIKKIKEAEKNLKDKEYVSAIQNFGEAKSVVGLVKVINALEKRKETNPNLRMQVPNDISLFRYIALTHYQQLTGVSY